MSGNGTNRNERKRLFTFSLRRLLGVVFLLCVLFGLAAIQQQRQGKYHRIVQFVEGTFDPTGAVPIKIANHRTLQNTNIAGNRWVSSIAHPPNNGPSFISSEHELIYRPSVDGRRIADITVVTSWHVLRANPRVSISIVDGELNDSALECLDALTDQFGVVPTVELKR